MYMKSLHNVLLTYAYRTDPASTESQGTSTHPQYGRDAALAGAGATAAGAGAYALDSREKDTGPATHTIGPHRSDAANIADPRVQPEPEKMKNTGTKDTNTGPASATLGPHQSNLANIGDPRVQPEPEKMKDRETTGPHRSDLLSRLDPRVQSSRKNVEGGTAGADTEDLAGGDPNISNPYNVRPIDNRIDAHQGSHSQEKEHHYGRDAAVAGGATAAGTASYGAYEASKNQEKPTSSTQPLTTSQPTAAAAESQSSRTPHQTGASQPSGVSQPGDANYSSQPATTTQQNRSEMPGAFPEPAEQEKPHYGRDAAVAGGAAATGAGAYGAYEASKPSASESVSSSQPSDIGYGTQTSSIPQQPSAVPSSKPSGNVYDSQTGPTDQQSSRASPSQPSEIGYGSQTGRDAPRAGAVTSGPARVTESSGPLGSGSQSGGYDGQQEPQHHYGRDAAVGGGVGGAGFGAYEASKHAGDSSRDPKAGHTEYGGQEAPTGPAYHSQPTSQSTGSNTQQAPQHHYGRDAAIAGGAGATGVGAYEVGKHVDDSRHVPTGTTPGYDSQRAEIPTGHPAHRVAVDTTGMPSATDAAPDVPTKAQKEEPKEHHYGRDAAVAGGTGAVGAGAAYEHQQHEAEKRAKQAQAQAEKEAKQHQKELEKSQAQADKSLKTQAKANEKEAKKEHKEHDKATAAAEKEHRKETEKLEKEHEKALAAAEKDHKKKEEKELAAGAGGAAAAGGAMYAAEDGKHQDEEKHKKPGLLEKILHPRRTKEQSSEEAEAAENERIIRGKAHDHESQAHGVSADEGGRHRLHKDPPASHPAAQGDEGVVTEKHTGLPMNVGQYGSGQGGTDGADRQVPGYQGEEVGGTVPHDRVVIEPHTGLPMNVGKYGSGAGGTDGAEQIRNPAEQGFEPRKTDWDEVKKANTPY